MEDIEINLEYKKLIEEVKQLKEDIASLYEEKEELYISYLQNYRNRIYVQNWSIRI